MTTPSAIALRVKGVRGMRRTPRGFTLIELMVTVAVSVILLAIAVPSYIDFMRSNKLSTHVNTFVQALHQARLQARGRGATLCASKGLEKCESTAVWSDGWIIFSDYDANGILNGDDKILRVGEPFPAGFAIKADALIVSFGRQGFSVPAGATHSFELCIGRDGKGAGRLVTVNIAGAPATVPFDSCPAA